MNVQNIPSHAVDIRHMFRATPETTETIQTNILDDTEEFVMVLNRYDSVKVDGKYVDVEDLAEGNTLILKEGALDVPCSVSKIEKLPEDPGKLRLCLHINK